MANIGTVEGWMRELDPNSKWMEVEKENRKVTKISCKICKEFEGKIKYCRNFNRAFIDGISTTIKKDSLAKHCRSDMHVNAMEIATRPAVVDFFNATPLGRGFRKSAEDEVLRVGNLIDIVYMLAKTEKPFSMFKDIVALEKSHGVDLGSCYHTEPKAAEFAQCISEVMKRELIENLAKSPPYFSIFIDGSTDASVVEQELLYVLHLSDGVPTLKFLEIKSVEHAHAEGITESITESLADFSLQDIAMVAFCADGASVNMGNRNGVAARLRREQPCLITIHCLNHRLELAAKDAFKNTKEEEVIEMLNSLYYLYQKSPKRWRELQKVAEVMEDSVLKPQKANGTRWVQHKARACKAVIVSYSALIGHLENQSEDGNVPPVDRAKVKGYLKKLKSVSFVLHLLLLKEILSPLSILSESLQKNVTYFHLAMSNVAHFYERIGSLGVEDIDAEPMPKRPAFEEINLSAFLKAVEVHREEPVTFKGVELTRGAVSVEAFKRQMSTLVENVQQAVRTRFGDVHDDPRFQMMKLLDTSSWPKSKEDLNKFGTEEVITFKEHFGSLIKSQGADPEELLEEWGNLKFFWHRSLSHLNVDDTWAAVILRYSDVYPNLVHMVYVMLLVPVSNAAVERGFSAMGRIKTDHRNRLNSSTLDSLMRITLDGPDPSEYDSTHAAELFFSKTSRRRGRTSS